MTQLRSDDLECCRGLLARGSKSFSLASRLLPAGLRDDAAIFYAYCRVADDLVDEGDDPKSALEELRQRLDLVFSGQPVQDPVDRAVTYLVETHALPRAPFDALLEGFEWDVRDRSYETLGQVIDYSARVASAVGVVMTMIMGVRDRFVLARACDLGAAMQLTNIARDVEEDARRGRCYLPNAWLKEEGSSASKFVAVPQNSIAARKAIERLLNEADRLYARSEAGMPHLPRNTRMGVYAARLIYADIGRVIRQRGYDPTRGRAVVGLPRKLWLAARALVEAPWRLIQSRYVLQLREAPLEEMRFLLPIGKTS